MIKISKSTKIYAFCPAAFASGGPELLHQLVYKLKQKGYDANMYYWFSKYQDENIDPVHENYKHYNLSHVVKLKDKKDQVIIFPEIETGRIYKYPKSTKAIWWLSVDFFFISWDAKRKFKEKLKKKLGIIKRYRFEEIPGLYHLAQSYYALDFLSKKGIDKNVGYLSDYLNKTFLENIPKDLLVSNRKDQVLYNPKKGLEKVNLLKKNAPEISWIPIENMSFEEILQLQQDSKVYIDFGFHPGKDRIPREAAINGCCVITGMEGAARFHEDIPISEEYKIEFNEDNVTKIIEKIKDCFENYETNAKDFVAYKQMILDEESKFEEDIDRIFVKN